MRPGGELPRASRRPSWGRLTISALVVRGLVVAAVAGGARVVLALLPVPGAAALLPLVVVLTTVLGALVSRAVTRQPVASRPHPLPRAALAVPVLVVVVGALLSPARAPDPLHRALADWLTDPASPARVLEAPPALWADLVRDGVPADRLHLAEGRTPSSAGWTVTVGNPGLARSRLVFGEGRPPSPCSGRSRAVSS